MSATGWSAWPAPAKLNLFLRITGRRADGFHHLQTVFRMLDWGDTVHLRPREDGRIVRHGFDLEAVPEASDLSLRAANLLKKEFNVGQGADIRVEKRIPAGGGFGGGSSDAATVLCALDALWDVGAGSDALQALGARLGADVPVFVGARTAWAEGVGEVLVPVELPPAWYLVADPGVHVATAALFQAPELTRDAAPATMSDFASGAPLGNVFEPVLRALEPAVEAAFQVLSRVGTPRLTGTGSGCFVEFATRGRAEAALAALPAGLHARVAAGVSRSPLLDALAAWSPQGRRQVAQGTGF
ncbi:4-(cytidine 5'-diphospho)-2-C-methyl-D-erythritol kinase [Luteimonas sp. MJ246]|uniref:4-(cytidine 5'-diphospho)-2-C-methyl-D-erythritol kinase n=1 Tax=Luteimonas sp. MJ174 TaxID=3129237 RepID=UPI0031BB5975